MDVGTQWSPQEDTPSSPDVRNAKRKERSSSPLEQPSTELMVPAQPSDLVPVSVEDGLPLTTTTSSHSSSSAAESTSTGRRSSPKRQRGGAQIKELPPDYEDCEPSDLVKIIAGMLMELIRFNDAIPLQDGKLTRFHSRAPPGISVVDYLQRLTTHATLSPPLLLSMVYYIDRLCTLYPAFTISSLTVHRFLIASATVAAKGLSDSFWTNNVYARVGGVSLKELALLELEFLWRVEWRIVPKPEVLVDYYRNLVERSDDYTIKQPSVAQNRISDDSTQRMDEGSPA